jgi:hypothetical protein
MNILLQCTSRVGLIIQLFYTYPRVWCVRCAPLVTNQVSPPLWLTCAYPAVCLQSLINLNFRLSGLPGYFRRWSGCFCSSLPDRRPALADRRPWPAKGTAGRRPNGASTGILARLDHPETIIQTTLATVLARVQKSNFSTEVCFACPPETIINRQAPRRWRDHGRRDQ